jgi:hypothetical protein
MKIVVFNKICILCNLILIFFLEAFNEESTK